METKLDPNDPKIQILDGQKRDCSLRAVHIKKVNINLKKDKINIDTKDILD